MLLISAEVGPFKSINSPQTVAIDKTVTVFVGMNESGKTVFLESLQKSRDVLALAKFKPIDDYPRKDLPKYLKHHEKNPATVTKLTYQLLSEELSSLNDEFSLELKSDFQFSIHHRYDNASSISIKVDEMPILAEIIGNFSTDTRSILEKAESLRSIPTLLKDASLTEDDQIILKELETRISKVGQQWSSVIEWEVWGWLKARIPDFLYFSDYDLLPSKLNLADLAQRVENAKSDPKHLAPHHRAVLALLRMADISVRDLTNPGGYEQLKAKIEGVSINLTDQIMEFWKQNEELEVEVDIKADPEDESPYNNGANLYLRIKNRRHRGVSTPFQQRSRGFIWFFSFLVWFDSVQHQIDTTGKTEQKQLILLLDEPGLALHALAQNDFLRYIDKLAEKHQVIYTTHSPFMVHSDRLHQVRVVEDKVESGTVISDNITSSDPRTIFPLQAALGWTIAQNLFISERNLLVEGPSELIYLKSVSAFLESLGRVSLRTDITIVPVGGLDKVATFVALLGANSLKLVVLHDYRGAPEQKLTDLVKQKLLAPKALLNASQFRDLTNIGKDGIASDIEDLFEPNFYINLFNRTFSKELSGRIISASDLQPGNRIIERLEDYLEKENIRIRPSGGFNHYLVASNFASHPPTSLDDDALSRFEALFNKVNSLY